MDDYKGIGEFSDGMDIFEREADPVYRDPFANTSQPKRKGFARSLFVAMLAIAVGGAFLGLGASAGYVVARNYFENRSQEVVSESSEPYISTIAHEPIAVAIDPQTPDFTDVIANVKDAVVSISVTSVRQGGNLFGLPSEGQGAGSGFFFDEDEDYIFVATNYHVISNAATIAVSIDDNEEVPAQVIGAAPEYDLAVLAVSRADLEEKGVPFVVAPLGDSSVMRMGDFVVAIGNAMGAGQTVTKGIISAMDLQITVSDQNTRASITLDVLQTDAAVNQGNSGGPLINQRGEVIGIVTAKLFGTGIEGMGYVLPMSNIYEILMEMMAYGSARRPWMGIGHDTVNESTREMFNLPAVGILVTEVLPGTPAEEAGFELWDLIVMFDGATITTRENFIDALWARRPGDEVIVGIYRNGEYMEITMVLGGQSLVR